MNRTPYGLHVYPSPRALQGAVGCHSSWSHALEDSTDLRSKRTFFGGVDGGTSGHHRPHNTANGCGALATYTHRRLKGFQDRAGEVETIAWSQMCKF